MVDKDRYKEVVKISLSEDDERDISLIDLGGGNISDAYFIWLHWIDIGEIIN